MLYKESNIQRMFFCQYKDIFGAPKTGIHSHRMFNLAVWDIVLTIIVACMFYARYRTNLLFTIIGFFVFGIVMHRLFCVRTTIDKLLFPEAKIPPQPSQNSP